MPVAPQTRIQLYQRANALCGLTVGKVASRLNIPLPTQPVFAKGFVGQIAEIALGASAGANPIQDFPELGVELKTIPLGKNLLPTETTHVCILPNAPWRGLAFNTSNVLNKMRCVLWLPIEGDTSIPLPHRKFGPAFLWEMNKAEHNQLKADWEEIMEALVLGQNPRNISSIGCILQLRPAGKRGNEYQYGFYLRRSFTNTMMQSFFEGKFVTMQEKLLSANRCSSPPHL